MFRKSLFPILCAATYAAAIPLRIGESWVWRVSDRGNTSSIFRSARILDSVVEKEGTVWRIQGRDSTSQKVDTGHILSLANGKQYWLQRSIYLPWELGPRPEPEDTVRVIGSRRVLSWGNACGFFETSSDISSPIGGGCISKFVDDRIHYYNNEYGGIYPVSKGIWSDSLGIERSLIHLDRFNGFDPSLNKRGSDWELVSHNGKHVELPPNKIHVPPAGTSVTWQMYDFKSGFIGMMKLQVHEILEDSSGWIGIEGSVSRKGECPACPVCDTFSYSALTIRMNPLTGQTIGNSSFSWVSDGWWERWDARPFESLYFDFGHMSWDAEHLYSFGGPNSAQLFQLFRNNQIDTSFCQSWDLCHPSWVRLLQIDDTAIRTEIPVSRLPRIRRQPGRLQEIAQETPVLPIRFSTASGRTGTLTASEIVQRPAALRGKTLFLQAHLPDGRLWQGTHVVP